MHSIQISNPCRRGMEHIYAEDKAENGFTLWEGGNGRRAREENLLSVRKRHIHSEVTPKLLKRTRWEAKSSIRI